MILREIVEHKRHEVSERETRLSLEEVKCQAAAAPRVRSPAFDGAMSLIAEVKRRSPSRGWIHPPGSGRIQSPDGGEPASPLDPAAQARAYEQGGAAAISVLTDERFFGGGLEDLVAVRNAVRLPILCKDFILTPYQVHEARARGADLVLLIVAALDDQTLVCLQDLALQLGMTPLVEVHDQHELARAIAADARLIGINNRDLTDLSVDLLTTEYLAPLVPDEAIVVSESGLTTREDVQRVKRAGARVVLVGETLMRAADPAATIRELLA